MGICRLCLEEKKLIRAHIIPKGFYKYLYPENGKKEALLIIRNNDKSLRSPVGEYDENILCADCDGRLGIYDNYAQEIILKSTPEPFLDPQNVWKIDNVDYDLLKMFFISLLWRASISKREFFEEVDLGPYEKKCRLAILENNSGSVDDYSLIFTKFTSNESKEILNKNITVPIRHRVENFNFYIIYLPNAYKVYIKVDKQSLKRSSLWRVCLNKESPLIILNAGIFEKSPEFNALMRAIPKKIT